VTVNPFISAVTAPLAVTSGNLSVNLSAYAPLASPAFTGNPTAPTATFGDNDTSIATTAFVQAGLAGGTAVARNLEVEVRNQSGSTIPAGSIVYISGATGNKPLITLAQANNDTNSAQTIGFVKTAIANNGTGYVIVRGELENINTSALTEGVQLYLSPTTAGTWTTTKPSAPQHLVYVGIVIRSHPTLGTILVAVQNGYELGEIHDVALGTLANNDLLAYESSTDLWKNKTYSALGLLTSSTAASTYQTLSGMSSYLAKADNLSGLASTSSARTNLGLGTIATVNEAPSDGSTYGRNNGAWVVAGGGSFPADALTTNEVNAVADAEYADFGQSASVSITYGSGILAFYDTSISSDGKLITINGGNSFALSSGSSWGITLMTDSADPGYPKYVEDLVSFINAQGASLTATWSGTPATNTVDNLTTYSPLELNRTAVGIQSGDRLMIEQGLRQYLTSNALSLSAAYNDVLTYPGPAQNNIVSWGKPWQSENYATISLVSTKANSVNSALTGNVTINSNSANAALFITQLGTGDILTLYDQAADTTFVAIDANGKVNTIPSEATNGAGFNVPHGAAPTTPVNGDVWTTTTGLFYRINGATVSPATLAGGTYTGKINTVASTTGTAGFRLPAGTAPTTPVDGDMWTVSGGGLLIRLQGATRNIPFRETNNTYTAAAKQTVSHSASSAGLNVGGVSADVTTPVSGDIWNNTGTQHIVGFSQTMRGAMTAVRAMCQVNVSGGTPSAVHSFNLSSITDNGVGDFTINFTNALFDANYLVTGSTAGNAGNNGSVVTTTRSTGSCRVSTIWNGALADVTNFSVAILR
jgi:hypothetical protein